MFNAGDVDLFYAIASNKIGQAGLFQSSWMKGPGRPGSELRDRWCSQNSRMENREVVGGEKAGATPVPGAGYSMFAGAQRAQHGIVLSAFRERSKVGQPEPGIFEGYSRPKA